MDYKKLAIATTLGLGLVAPLATPFSEVGLVAKANEEVTFYPVPQADIEASKEYADIDLKIQKDKFYSGYTTNNVKNETIFETWTDDVVTLPLSSTGPVGYIFVTDKEITKEIAEANLDKATKVSAQFDGVKYIKGTTKVEFPALSKGTSGADNKKEDKKDDKATNKETDKKVTPTLTNKKDDKKLESTTDKKDNKTPLTSDAKITSVTNKETKVLPKTSAVSEKAKNNNSYLLPLGLATLGLLILSKKIKN